MPEEVENLLTLTDLFQQLGAQGTVCRHTLSDIPGQVIVGFIPAATGGHYYGVERFT